MEKIESMIAAGRYDEAMDALGRAISGIADGGEEQTRYLARLYFIRGKLHWRLGDRRNALNDYAAAESLDPDSPASTALAQARSIMDFHAPDLYNP